MSSIALEINGSIRLYQLGPGPHPQHNWATQSVFHHGRFYLCHLIKFKRDFVQGKISLDVPTILSAGKLVLKQLVVCIVSVKTFVVAC